MQRNVKWKFPVPEDYRSERALKSEASREAIAE